MDLINTFLNLPRISKQLIVLLVDIISASLAFFLTLVIILENKPIICKIVDSYKDIESGLLYLSDVNNLIGNAGFDSPAFAIIPTEKKETVSERTLSWIEGIRNKYEFTLISLEDLWNISSSILAGEFVDLKKVIFK